MKKDLQYSVAGCRTCPFSKRGNFEIYEERGYFRYCELRYKGHSYSDPSTPPPSPKRIHCDAPVQEKMARIIESIVDCEDDAYYRPDWCVLRDAQMTLELKSKEGIIP